MYACSVSQALPNRRVALVTTSPTFSLVSLANSVFLYCLHRAGKSVAGCISARAVSAKVI